MLKIIQGDALQKLNELPAESVQCCVTSPPYWSLRDYDCAGQLGLEPTPEEYVENLVRYLGGVRRVLRKDGTLWLVIGDTYSSGGRSSYDSNKVSATSGLTNNSAGNRRHTPSWAKPKDLIGIPWMVAFALRADGWYLRSDIIWYKPNPMPESCKDRPTHSHEYVFFLTRSANYYYDYEAILEPAAYDGRIDTMAKAVPKYETAEIRPNQGIQTLAKQAHERWPNKLPYRQKGDDYGPNSQPFSSIHAQDGLPARNKRSVWRVPTQNFSEAHFATYPPDLIKPCILAGTKAGDTVLDPFGGSGTTGMVALELGRKAILIELKPEYCKLIDKRCTTTIGFAF